MIWINAAPVGAGLPAMVVNDNACDLDERGSCRSWLASDGR
ncbi:hypothetical protein [Pseudomonas laurylsulfatiphila]